ncbi:MAG: flagellar export chaperone FliS [Oleispira sp.]|nr:flagellar export chaperone FliS [Oleispira sp.]
MYNKGANQYRQVGATSEVAGADPHRLIQMLMEGALTRMSQAKGMIEEKNHQGKAKLLNRVMEIIATLQSSLDHETGGDISANLDRLYDYMNRRLLEASSLNDVSMVDEVMSLLLEIKTGWDGIRDEYLASTRKKPSEQDITPKASMASHSA